LKRLPDGEVGGRRLWISWQLPLLRSMQFLENVDPSKGTFSTMRLKADATPDEIEFGELGYAREARMSYQDFLAAKKRGEIAPDVRFMVALPTPYGVVQPFIAAESEEAIEAAYEKAMLKEVDRICAAIPHADLCIQWDVCIEMVQWDGNHAFWKLPSGETKTKIVERLRRIGEAVPADVELGYHLCYGDMDAKHFFDPVDAGQMVDLSNAISAAVKRPIGYIHMPVPIDRDDDAFFKPFDALKLHPETEIYLGVVHLARGVEGVNKKVAAAHKHLKDFGIATECGIARVRTPQLVEKIIELHAEGAREPAH
jgi:methionine synthase II (cobalamin-independent)